MEELAEMLPSVMTQLKWVWPVSSWSMIMCINWPVVDSRCNQWFLRRVNSMIGIGVGAGAYILSLFAVSPHQDHPPFLPCYRPLRSVFASSNNCRISGHTACGTLKPPIRAHTGQQVSPQSAAFAVTPQMMNHLGHFSPFHLLTTCFCTQSICTMERKEPGVTERTAERWIIEREDGGPGKKGTGLAGEPAVSLRSRLLFRINEDHWFWSAFAPTALEQNGFTLDRCIAAVAFASCWEQPPQYFLSTEWDGS